MRLGILFAFFLALGIQQSDAANSWCAYTAPNGNVLLNEPCVAQVQHVSNACNGNVLDASYELKVGSKSKARIETRCDESSGLSTVFLNGRKGQIKKVNSNGRTFFNWYSNEDSESFAFEKPSEFLDAHAPPWSSLSLSAGTKGTCFLISRNSYARHNCQKIENCRVNDESGEQSCDTRYSLDDDNYYRLLVDEETYRISAANEKEFYFPYGIIIKDENEECYPVNDSGDLFCFNIKTLDLAACPSARPIWVSRKDDREYILFGSHGVSYGSEITIEERRNGKAAWKAKGFVTCSNGASICYAMMNNNSGLGGEKETTGVIIEVINLDDRFVPQWVVLAAHSQNLWYSNGLKVDWLNGFGPKDEFERVTAPNIYERKACGD